MVQKENESPAGIGVCGYRTELAPQCQSTDRHDHQKTAESRHSLSLSLHTQPKRTNKSTKYFHAFHVAKRKVSIQHVERERERGEKDGEEDGGEKQQEKKYRKREGLMVKVFFFLLGVPR